MHRINTELNENEIKLLLHAIEACISEFADEDIQKEYGITPTEYVDLAGKLGLSPDMLDMQ